MNGKTLAAAVLGLGLIWADRVRRQEGAPKPDDKQSNRTTTTTSTAPGPHGG